MGHYIPDNERLEVTIDDDDRAMIHPKEKVRLVFGPHHFVDVFKEEGGIRFVLGVTHHGLMMDATSVGSELENFIWEVREKYPDYVVD